MDVSSQVDFLIGQVLDARRLWSQNSKQVFQDREIYAQHLFEYIKREFLYVFTEKLIPEYEKSFYELADKARTSINVWSEYPDNITIRSKSHILVNSLTVAASEMSNRIRKDVEDIARNFRKILANWEHEAQPHKINLSAEGIMTFAGEQALSYEWVFGKYGPSHSITNRHGNITETIKRNDSNPWNLKYEFSYTNEEDYDNAEGIRQELAKAKNLKGLEINESHGWGSSLFPESVVQSFAGILEDHPSLQTLILNIGNDTFDLKGAQILAEGISKLKNLSEFECQSTSFREDPFAALDKLTNALQNQPLKRLKFAFRQLQNSDVILKKFKDLRSLIVEFKESSFPESAVSQLLKTSPNLNKLELEFERPDDKESLKELIESISDLKNLRMLSLEIKGSCTPDETILDFWKVIQHLPLEGVSLRYQNTKEESSPGSRDKITQTMVEALKKMKRLQYLSFYPQNSWESLEKPDKSNDLELPSLERYPYK